MYFYVFLRVAVNEAVIIYHLFCTKQPYTGLRADSFEN